MKSNTCKACKILVTYKIFLLTLRSEQEICRSAVNVFAYVRSSRPAAVGPSDGTFDFIWQWSCQFLLGLSRPGFKHSMRTLEPTVPPHRVTINVAPKNPVCSMAVSISICQKLQPFTGNGDISMWVKNSKVEQIINWSRVSVLLKVFFLTYNFSLMMETLPLLTKDC